MNDPDRSLRLGFDVQSLESLLNKIEYTNWKIKSGISVNEWGKIAVIQDLDGRKIELKSV